MTTSPLTRKVSMSLLSKDLLVVTYKVNGIVKVLDIIPFILLRPVFSPTNKILYCAAFTFLYCLLVKQILYLERFCSIGITVNKHGGWNVRVGAMERIVGWGRCYFQLSH